MRLLVKIRWMMKSRKRLQKGGINLCILHQILSYTCFGGGKFFVLRKCLLDQVATPRGPLRVVVATSAFGMGLDVPDVHVVMHWGPTHTCTIEKYIQESGRCGRDGKELHKKFFNKSKSTAMEKHFIKGLH